MEKKKMNIGKEWVVTMQLSGKDKELFSVYKSELPLVTELCEDFIGGRKLREIKLADFGGGTGEVTEFLKKVLKTKIRCTCFDVNNDLLDKNNSADIKININLTELQEKEKFDVGIMRFVLNYNTKESQIKILQNVHTALKKEGIFLNWWCGTSEEGHQKRFNTLFSTKKVNGKLFRPNSYWTTWKENEQLFEKAGFKLEVVRKFDLPVHHLYQIRYELSDQENKKILTFLDNFNFISYVIFKATKVN